jgi:DNA-binding transcriptional regulator YiaG
MTGITLHIDIGARIDIRNAAKDDRYKKAKITKIRFARKTEMDFSSPQAVKALRKSLGVSVNQFGKMMGLEDRKKAHMRLVQKWESGESSPSNLARMVMSFLSEGVAMGSSIFFETIPRTVIGEPDENGRKVIVRLRYPRFVAVIGNLGALNLSAGLEDGRRWLNVCATIDPAPPEALQAAICESAKDVDQHLRSPWRLGNPSPMDGPTGTSVRY